MIELKNISKVFHQKKKEIIALAEVSLHVPKGKIFGVIGSSGAGKSTLIRCVNLLERPTQGQVLVDGVDLMSLSASQLAQERRQIGMIFQNFNLLSARTVADNIGFPLELDNTPKEQAEKRINELLKLVGLEEKANAYPANLSGGQKQRVAIARALASNPKVLLCDEATSALDPATTSSILSLLKDINKRLGITIMLITHEMEVIKSICDEIAVISFGRLIEQGPVSEIFTNPQTQVTRELIESSIKINLPDAYKAKISKTPAPGKIPLIKLEFTGNSVDEPVVSEVSRLFSLNNNIISAQIEYAGDIQFGAMILEVSGSPENHQMALAYYKQKQIKVEELGYV
ncbi:methionine ABC transporter ATP-binding protein MetN [Pedobacter sp.]|uniref:methionine ABC transporter ATP-binding protein MetN n=1 Tax=Pedobacter sp. TaxID=1411316 RepID=UPI003D7FA2E4